MSDSELTAFIREVREAIHEIKQDILKIQNDHDELFGRKRKKRWYNWFTNN